MAKKYPFWASQAIIDIGNGDPNIIEPDQTKKDRGWEVEKPRLQHMNWIQGLLSWFVVGLTRIFTPTVNFYQTEVGERVTINNSTADQTAKLPIDPEDGQWVEIGTTDLVSENKVTVTCKLGHTIMIPNDRIFEYDIDGAVFMFYYKASESRWYARITGSNGAIE